MKTIEQEPRNIGEISKTFFRSDKIKPEHFEKLAIVYVRQSSQHQVLENRESTARQYALADYAQALGWQADRVIVIDEDQGRSGTGIEHRSGFQRLLSEITLDHVSLVLGLEMSRLARSSKDWHHLLELCAIFGTLLADQDGVYDSSDPNDRLLLGLKGTMSEVELHTMRNRLERGRQNKAQRGELFYSVPFGYVILPSGEVVLDPDEQARSVVQLLFDKFDELQAAFATFRWLYDHKINLPMHARSGANKGELEWRPVTLATINQTLHNPIYAGAYAYGRRKKVDKKPGSNKSRWLPHDQWEVLIHDQLPSYITWDQYLKNQAVLKQNLTRSDSPGIARNGKALLSSLLECGQCGYRMQASYRTVERPYYNCHSYHAMRSSPKCKGISALCIDEVVVDQLLRALKPVGLEVSLKAQQDQQREGKQLEKQWKQKLKRAEYEVELAERRYRAVDPDNRLVAASLEQQWESVLRKERDLEEEYHRNRRCKDQLTDEQINQINELAMDIPSLWNAPSTSNADRKTIVRCLIDKVVVHIENNTELSEAVIHWKGGFESRHEVIRPVQNYEQLRDTDRLMQRIAELRDKGSTAGDIANKLNKEGFRSINPKLVFTGDIIGDLLRKANLRGEIQDGTLLDQDEWWIRDLAKELGIKWQTFREWGIKGWIHSRRTKIQKLWIIWADEGEIQRMRKLLIAKSRGIYGYPHELLIPNERPDTSR